MIRHNFSNGIAYIDINTLYRTKQLRIEKIMPSVLAKKKITLDFDGVNGVTQSFIHALLAETIREFPEDAFELIEFKNCTRDTKVVIEIVAEYMQEGAN